MDRRPGIRFIVDLVRVGLMEVNNGKVFYNPGMGQQISDADKR